MQKSTVGGILSIVAGALGFIGSLLMLVFAVVVPSILNDPSIVGYNTINPGEAATIIAAVYGVIGAIGLILSVLGIIGGIFSIQRKHWGWALAGAIAGCLTFLPLGVGAVVLVAMGKSEFNQNTPAVTPQPSVSNLT